jgi:hypothetical protein
MSTTRTDVTSGQYGGHFFRSVNSIVKIVFSTGFYVFLLDILL